MRKKLSLRRCFVPILSISFCFIIIGSFAFQAGKEFKVNTYTDDRQREPAIAMDKRGNFVITWMSRDQDGSGYGIFARRFKKRGKALKANLAEKEGKARRQQQEETRKRIKTEAAKKLKQGKKLSLEEFKLATEEHHE